MGFGLHVGWAIEGAIGSDYKIDASYLSPNVNMASRLEAATKQFGVTMLLSDDFVSLLSPGVRRRVRQVAISLLHSVCPPHPLQGITAAAAAAVGTELASPLHTEHCLCADRLCDRERQHPSNGPVHIRCDA